MANEIEQAIDQLKKIERQTLSNISAHPNMSERQLIETCIKQVVTYVWLFHYVFGEEIGGYSEEVEHQSGQTVARADGMIHASNGNIVYEVKAPCESLDKHEAQAHSYGYLFSSIAVILTNGKEWRIYITGYDKKLIETPYRVFKFGEMTDDDYKAFVELFRPQYTFNLLKMRSDMKNRRETEAFKNAERFFTMKLMDFMTNGNMDIAKQWTKEYEGVASIGNMDMPCRLPAFQSALANFKSHIEDEAVAEYKRNQNLSNHVEAQELAIGAMCEVFAESHGYEGVFFEDGANSGASYVKNANKKTILTIKGESTAENGWAFKGICFPGKTKTPSSIIPCNTIADVKKHFDTLLWVLDNIDRPDWADQWAKKFGSAA